MREPRIGARDGSFPALFTASFTGTITGTFTRGVIGLVATAFLVGCSATGQASGPISTAVPSEPFAASDDLDVVFVDEFDDDLGDEWSTCYWWQTDGGCTISSNDEAQWYRPEAVEVSDGAAVLTLSADEQTTTDDDTLPYRSGMISTGHADADVDDPGFAFTYGVVEARVRFPEGAGLWPAVWLLSADRTSLPEIDIVEWYGSRASVVTSHVHQRIDDERSSQRISYEGPESFADEWHTVALEWTADEVVFYFDGTETGRVDDAELVPHDPMYLIINLAAGGPAGDVDADALPQRLLVDYVRVWQHEEDAR